MPVHGRHHAHPDDDCSAHDHRGHDAADDHPDPDHGDHCTNHHRHQHCHSPCNDYAETGYYYQHRSGERRGCAGRREWRRSRER
jgi:hypothetical protein